jgi:hypothetical protein
MLAEDEQAISMLTLAPFCVIGPSRRRDEGSVTQFPAQTKIKFRISVFEEDTDFGGVMFATLQAIHTTL